MDIESEYYKIARQYMARMEREDVESPEAIAKFSQVLKISPEDFTQKFGNISEDYRNS